MTGGTQPDSYSTYAYSLRHEKTETQWFYAIPMDHIFGLELYANSSNFSNGTVEAPARDFGCGCHLSVCGLESCCQSCLPEYDWQITKSSNGTAVRKRITIACMLPPPLQPWGQRTNITLSFDDHTPMPDIVSLSSAIQKFASPSIPEKAWMMDKDEV